MRFFPNGFHLSILSQGKIVNLRFSSLNHHFHHFPLAKFPKKLQLNQHFLQFNHPFSLVQSLFSQVKSPFSIVKSSFSLIQSPFSLVKSSFSLIQSPFSLVKSSFSLIQSPFSLVKSSLSLIQSPFSLVQSSFSPVQSSFSQVKSPFSQVKSPFSIVKSPFSIVKPDNFFPTYSGCVRQPGVRPLNPPRNRRTVTRSWNGTWIVPLKWLVSLVSSTIWIFNIAMESMAHRNRWFSH